MKKLGRKIKLNFSHFSQDASKSGFGDKKWIWAYFKIVFLLRRDIFHDFFSYKYFSLTPGRLVFGNFVENHLTYN